MQLFGWGTNKVNWNVSLSEWTQNANRCHSIWRRLKPELYSIHNAEPLEFPWHLTSSLWILLFIAASLVLLPKWPYNILWLPNFSTSPDAKPMTAPFGCQIKQLYVGNEFIVLYLSPASIPVGLVCLPPDWQSSRLSGTCCLKQRPRLAALK